MEFLYNPDSMREEEIKATFVARHGLIDELAALIARQPDGAGVQHVMIIAPRGMGKTTVLLMLRFAIRDGALAADWQPVKFAEESYGVYDISDFWLEALTRLAAETEDPGLLARAEELRAQYPDSEDLQEAALALLKDWRREHGKRLVLLVDNFDMILEQINDERDNAQLRDALMNDGTMMLIGGATTFFREARAYEQPLYNFFKIYNLYDLKFEQMLELLRRRAELDKRANFEELLKANESRLRVLEYFTGGNPRIVLMLYRVVTQSGISEVRGALEKLLDEVTPYYKGKIESLPAQQRKILDCIARISSRTREGVRPAEIATETRLKPNQVSAQLQRLSELGYVRAANLRARNSYYTLSEPLYAIWHQMRFGRDARQRMRWLVDFLKGWYAVAEIETEHLRLAAAFREHLTAGRLHDARNALDHRRYLTEAMDDSAAKTAALEAVIRSYLELGDFETLKREVIAPDVLRIVSEQTLQALRETGCINESKSPELAFEPADTRRQAEIEAASKSILEALSHENMDSVLQHAMHVLELEPDNVLALGASGFAFISLGRYEEAITAFDRALKIKESDHLLWATRGVVLHFVGKKDQAMLSLNRALAIKPDAHEVWRNRGWLFLRSKKYEEAIADFDRAVEINPKDAVSWYNRAVALVELNEYERGIASYDRTLELDSSNYNAWFNRGTGLLKLNKNEEALSSFNRALEFQPDDSNSWHNRGVALIRLNRYGEALTSFDRGVELASEAPQTWLARGITLERLKKYDESIKSYDQALKIDPTLLNAWKLRAYTCVLAVAIQIIENKYETARFFWDELLKSAEHFNSEEFYEDLTSMLLIAADRRDFQFIRQLITDSNLEERLFPLARALDYLQTGDETLIEKLSPEVRGIVEEVVGKLRAATGKGKPAKKQSRPRKAKAGTSKRTKKQLT